MTPFQIQQVRDTFAQLEPVADAAAALFYANLFEAEPALRKLFKSDMTDQGRRLLAMIGTGVSLLERPDQLLPALKRLGAHHTSYGVVDRHYETVGAALLRTLGQGLGERFTAEVAAAWGAFYALVSGAMREGAA
jgi:hemoglobin-like flavoprotein